MNVPDDTLLASYRIPGHCELCGKFCVMLCAAHVFSRGAGRVDHPWNLVKAGMDPLRDCKCHHNSHATGKPSREEFLRVVADREEVSPEHITETISAVRSCPRKSTLTAAWLWLFDNFERQVAESAFAICKKNYE